MPNPHAPYHPIIYVRGFAGTQGEIEDTVGGRSPDEADSLTLIVHAARQSRAGVVMTAQAERAAARDREIEESRQEALRQQDKMRMPYIHVN